MLYCRQRSLSAWLESFFPSVDAMSVRLKHVCRTATKQTARGWLGPGRQQEVWAPWGERHDWQKTTFNICNTIAKLYRSGLSSQHIYVFCPKMSNNDGFLGFPCRYDDTGAFQYISICTHEVLHRHFPTLDSAFPNSLTLHLISFHFLPFYPVSYMPFKSPPTSSFSTFQTRFLLIFAPLYLSFLE